MISSSWICGLNPRWIILFFALLALAEATEVKTEDTTLIQLHILWRHGNRTRVKPDTYVNDPYKNIPDPEGAGNLNKRGKARAYQLGLTLRERYGEFLGQDYLPPIHHVRSTQKRRAIDSAMLVMAGLFPPGPNQTWTSTGNEVLGQRWQPVDLIIEPHSTDNLLGNVHFDCPPMTSERWRVRLSEELRKDEMKVSDNGRILEYVSANAGQLINDSHIAQGVHNALLCEEDQGWALPPWTLTVYPEPLRTLAGLGLGQFGRTKLLQRLVVGPLLNFLISTSEQAGEASSPKFLGYSGHDNNIVTLLAALGLTQLSNTIPKYSAHVAWEVRQARPSNATYVRVLYEGEELRLPICNSQVLCTPQQLRESLSDIIVSREQHRKECKP